MEKGSVDVKLVGASVIISITYDDNDENSAEDLFNEVYEMLSHGVLALDFGSVKNVTASGLN